jgi:hypothetical protein
MMGCFRSLSLALTASLLILDLAAGSPSVQGQPIFTSPAHVPVPTEAAIGALTSLGLAVLLIALIAASVWFHRERRRRWEEAKDVEGQLAAALLRDPRLTGLLLVARVSVSMMPGKPVKIVVAGTIPTLAVRPVVLEIAREELKYAEGETIIEDRLTVSPAVRPIAA